MREKLFRSPEDYMCNRKQPRPTSKSARTPFLAKTVFRDRSNNPFKKRELSPIRKVDEELTIQKEAQRIKPELEASLFEAFIEMGIFDGPMPESKKQRKKSVDDFETVRTFRKLKPTLRAQPVKPVVFRAKPKLPQNEEGSRLFFRRSSSSNLFALISKRTFSSHTELPRDTGAEKHSLVAEDNLHPCALESHVQKNKITNYFIRKS